MTPTPDESYRTRIIRQGWHALTDAEVLAVVLGHAQPDEATATLRQLVQQAGGLGALARGELATLAALPGLGGRKALQVLAAFELGRRAARPDARAINFHAPAEVGAYLQPLLRDAVQEQLVVLLLDRAGGLLAERIVFVGGVTQTVVDPKVIFQWALSQQAPAFLVCHNHPSGTLTPSEHDFAITRRLQAGAELLDLQLVDHVIVSYKGYFSFAEHGYL